MSKTQYKKLSCVKKSIKTENQTSVPKNRNIADSQEFPIIGIGASAGGLEALELFFKNTPQKSGIAFVVIQHLDPTHVGIMPELLQRITDMKVMQASDHLLIKQNHVYVIPPNKNMSILNGYLYVFDYVELRGLRLPIDFFFRSLAEDQKEKSIGVILSGMGSDGSFGLKAIKEHGGIAAVQEPATAKFDGMPKSAIDSVNIDILAPAGDLPLKLIEFLRNSQLQKQNFEIDFDNKSNLGKILILLRARTGHDFSLYKKNTLFRRIERRMNVHQIKKLAHYIRFLQENPNELNLLFQELLIGVTNFFRNPEVWEKLLNSVFPKLFSEFPNGYTFRAWIAGGSTGEEAFSLAMIFLEATEKVKNEKTFNLQIFATDIDNDAIEKARRGVFSSNIVNDVSLKRISQFFSKEENVYRVKPLVREMVIFANHDLIKDPPFTKLDLLLCRNVLIYMEPELQKKLMNLFHYSLNKNGIMVLGSAENDNSQNNKFVPLDNKLKIYKRSDATIKQEFLTFPDTFSTTALPQQAKTKTMKISENIQILADQLLIQHYSPASVLVNQEGDILYITGRTGKYIEPAAGKANWNIYAMAREGLRNELPGAMRKAKQNFDAVKLDHIKIGINGGTQFVNIIFQQIEKPAAIKGTIMIVFNDVSGDLQVVSRKARKNSDNSSEREKELEIELLRAREELQNTREEMQTTQEELKSTNEEIQSTNEELTTSKEEMQSLNEELQTVNIELQSKVNDLLLVNNDMKNLLNSTDIGTLFLDKDLNIRRFTDKLTNIFKLRPTDIGRPFTDMVNDLI